MRSGSMLGMTSKYVASFWGLLYGLLLSMPASAGSHLWRISEVYSNTDGTIQFIELREIGGSDSEWHLLDRWFMTDSNLFVMPNNLDGDTANKTFLMGTESYAAQPGVPAPDYVLPDNFFDPSGDTMVWFTYDTFEVVGGQLPTDGVYSLVRDSLETAINSPTNFAQISGRVLDPAADFDNDGVSDPADNCLLTANGAQRDTDLDGFGNFCDADLNNDGVINFIDVGTMKAVFFTDNADADLNGDGAVNFSDLGLIKASMFSTPGPSGTTL